MISRSLKTTRIAYHSQGLRLLLPFFLASFLQLIGPRGTSVMHGLVTDTRIPGRRITRGKRFLQSLIHPLLISHEVDITLFLFFLTGGWFCFHG